MLRMVLGGNVFEIIFLCLLGWIFAQSKFVNVLFRQSSQSWLWKGEVSTMDQDGIEVVYESSQTKEDGQSALVSYINQNIPREYQVLGLEDVQVQFYFKYGAPFSFRRSQMQTYAQVEYGHPFQVLVSPDMKKIDDYDVLIVMLSRCNEYGLRNHVRTMTRENQEKYGFKIVFVLGNPGNAGVNAVVHQENEKYQDILQFSNVESYNNITLSVIYTFHYLHQQQLNIQYVLKTDSDCVINFELLEKLLSDIPDENKNRIYMGQCKGHSSYNTDDILNKNFVPLSLVANDTEIMDYAIGGGYIVSYKLLGELLVSFRHLSFIGHNEDVNTGKSLVNLNVSCSNPLGDNWIARFGCVGDDCFKVLIIHPKVSLNEVPWFYRLLSKKGDVKGELV